MKNIVILGGGFGGVSVGLNLLKLLDKDQASIKLIDKTDSHVFTPSLYEVATSEQPKRNIAIPYERIFGNKLEVINGEIESIDKDKKIVTLKNRKKFDWDYLVICLGSVPAYFGIAGMEKYSFPLKKLSDAVAIRDAFKKACKDELPKNRNVRVIVGGGGFSGTELVAELTNYRDRLIKGDKNLKDMIYITLIEGADRVLNGLDNKISDIAQKRLRVQDVRLILNCEIKKVTDKLVESEAGEKYYFDILIWTGGVKANNLIEKNGFKVNGIGQVKVDAELRVLGAEDVFGLGDCAEFIDERTNKPMHHLGQVAKDQGKVAAENIRKSIMNLELIKFKPKNYGITIPLRGRYVIADLHFIKFAGLFGWVLQQLAFLRYLIGILPFYRAIRRWNKFQSELEQD